MTSTNDAARQLLAESNHQLPLLVLTADQTAGRGQQHRRWWSGQGSLTFSLVVPATMEWTQQPVVALAAALAVARTIESTAADLGQTIAPRIKWPNDVYVAGKKIAGVLIETVIRNGNRQLIIGVGYNLNCSVEHAPANLRSQITSVRDQLGQSTDLTDGLLQVIKHLATLLDQQTSQPQLVVEQCQQRSWLEIGSPIVMELANGRKTRGIFVGLGENGQLLLDRDGQIEAFLSGAVVQTSREK